MKAVFPSVGTIHDTVCHHTKKDDSSDDDVNDDMHIAIPPDTPINQTDR